MTEFSGRDSGPIRDPNLVKAMIDKHRNWYHCIELMPGIVTPGIHDSPQALIYLDSYLDLPQDCLNLRALDIGCRDGFFSFELEKRGAEVVGLDYVLPERTGFPIAKQILGSHVEYVTGNVYDLSPEKHGTFDLVLFLGVLYHLRNPMLALDRIREICKPGALLFVETQLLDEYFQLGDGSIESLRTVSPKLVDAPIMQFYPRDSLQSDCTTKWAPNMACLKKMLEECQFEVLSTKVTAGRGFAKARAVIDSKLEYFRRLDSGQGLEWPTDRDGKINAAHSLAPVSRMLRTYGISKLYDAIPISFRARILRTLSNAAHSLASTSQMLRNPPNALAKHSETSGRSLSRQGLGKQFYLSVANWLMHMGLGPSIQRALGERFIGKVRDFFFRSPREEALDLVAQSWDVFAKYDPMWAILSDPTKRGNKWDAEEFFATGVDEMRNVMVYLDTLPIRCGRERALDFGCGIGRVTQAMAEHFQYVDGLDISPTMVERARAYNRYGERVTYHVSANTRLPFPDNSFDFLYSMIVLQHIEVRFARQYVAEFVRVIRPNGLALFQVPSRCLVANGAKFESPIETPDGVFTIDMNVFLKEQVLDTVAAAGGTVVDVQPDQRASPKFESFTYYVSKAKR